MVMVDEKYSISLRLKSQDDDDDEFSHGGMMARGGKTKGRYNEGLSWHQDHARFNKSEKYEKPLKRRRKY